MAECGQERGVLSLVAALVFDSLFVRPTLQLTFADVVSRSPQPWGQRQKSGSVACQLAHLGCSRQLSPRQMADQLSLLDGCLVLSVRPELTLNGGLVIKDGRPPLVHEATREPVVPVRLQCNIRTVQTYSRQL